MVEETTHLGESAFAEHTFILLWNCIEYYVLLFWMIAIYCILDAIRQIAKVISKPCLLNFSLSPPRIFKRHILMGE